jgi:hypothetical protein
MTCRICGRQVSRDDRFCRYHSVAYQNLKTGHSMWERACMVQWDDYLSALLEIEETGKWVREVIEYLTTQDDRGESP